MKRKQRQLIKTEYLVMGVLLLIGCALLAVAWGDAKSAEQPGWVNLNVEVSAALKELKPNEAGNTAGKAASDVVEAKNDASATDRSSASEKKSGEAAASAPQATAAAGEAGARQAAKININEATAQELDALPGIGAAKAKAIIEDRESNGAYKTVDELLRVKGIGEKMLAKIKPLIVALP